jgi:hypothetical protein
MYISYHERPLDAQNAQPIPMPGGDRSEKPKAGSRPPQGMGIAGPFWRALHAVSLPGPRRIIAQMFRAYEY